MRKLRPIDLARAAGISTQQVRNYEELGVLPPVPRTSTGYRQFTTLHRSALMTFRVLSSGHGWRAATDILNAVHDGDESRMLALIDASHAAQQAKREAMKATEQALRDLAESDPHQSEPRPRSDMRIGDVAGRLGVHTSALRFWEDTGLLHPNRDPVTRYRIYGPTELRDARIIQLLRESEYRFPEIHTILDDLRSTRDIRELNKALVRQQEQLNERARFMLHGARLLHEYLHDFLSAETTGGPDLPHAQP